MPLVGALKRLLPLMAALVVLPGTLAAQEPLYTVKNVDVDATAQSATVARAQGLDRAHVKAFDRMIERLVLRSELKRVPDLSADRIANYLRDFEVFNERTSDVRYLAEVTFRFHPQSIRQFLKTNDIPFAETRSKPVVVLPVWGEGQDAVLWDNPWREAWANRAEQVGLVPLTVPLGDLGDIRTVSAGDALDKDREALDQIAERYGAEDVLVTQARLAGDPDAFTGSMQIITARIGTSEMERTLVDNIQQQRDEPLAAMLSRAANRVARDVEETWKRANLLDFDQRNQLQVEVPLDGLDRWVSVRARLDAVARVEGYAVTALTRTAARLKMTYYGERAQLALALKQNDLVLSRANADGSTTEVDTQNAGQNAEQGARAEGTGTLTSDGSLGPDRMGQAQDPNDWVLRAAEMRTAAADRTGQKPATRAPNARQPDARAPSANGRTGQATDAPAEQPAVQ
ncbi:DUF2066 domain-containing protein [Rhodovibrio salinarum]|uniref:DUF2066 domain-containing protein n=1 Tax=Rhodovibrio salinarum TaxID=1087 RepID=A0A934QI82_9PROT|nr:DUF2066 domain-containing protein [Rhodovibrio salinarum]MBK1697516.1 DUF2066 domain-containing protein [Rhodovibrio salinarum]